MSLTNPNALVTEERLAEFYQTILPYLGGMPDILANKFAKGDLYSTDETIIGRWIDGKPIYQKTWTGLSISMSWNDKYLTTANFTITNHGFENIIKCLLHKTNKYVWQANAEISNANTINVQSVGADTFNSITLQYTKTTDSAVYIGDDTDYSTDEKIIGTWIDGSPIYQKTFTGLNVSVNGTNWATICTIPNVKYVVDLKLFYNNSGGLNTLCFKEAEPNNSNGTVKILGANSRTVSVASIQYTKSS